MTKKTKGTRVAEQLSEFIETASDAQPTASKPKPKSAAKNSAATKKSVAKSNSPKRVTTNVKKESGKTATRRNKTAPKMAPTKTTSKRSTPKRKRSPAKKVASGATKVNGANGHHPVEEASVAVAVLENEGVEKAKDLQLDQSLSSGFSLFGTDYSTEAIGDTVKGWFSWGQQETSTPSVIQPTPQAEFTPLKQTTETVIAEPEITQPGPQAEFSQMAETAPLSAPELQVQSKNDESAAVDTQSAEQPAPSPVEEDLEYVRVIRAMAMIVIVAEHLAFPLIYRYNEIFISEWWIGTGIYLFGKAGSPLFTMVSGLLLLNPSKNNQTLQVFFKKRFMKVLIPFLGWSAIYLAWQMYWIGVEYSAWDIMVAVVDGPVYYHLWFIQMILGLYLATPVMRIYTRHATRENMTYFLIVWFVGTALFPIVRRFYGFEIGIDIYVTVGFMGYFVLGYYFRPVKLNRQQMMMCLGVIIAFSLLTMGLTHWLVIRAGGKFDNFFALNTSFNIMILTSAFFLFMKSLDYKKIYTRYPWFQWFIKHVAGTSFGLYLVHVLIIEDFRSGRPGIQLHGMTWHPAIAIPVLTIATIAVSVIIVKRMQQVPVLKKIVP